MTDWFTASPDALLATVLSAVGIYVVLIVLVRLVGLRSFSKMTSVDFAMTVAMGSVIASTILTNSPSLPQAAVALASLFGIQFVVAFFRKRTDIAEDIVDNEPVVIMTPDGMRRDVMREERVTEDDVWAKLREANVIDPRMMMRTPR